VFALEQRYKFNPGGALVLKNACPTEHEAGRLTPWAYASAVHVFAALQLCNCRPGTPSLAKYSCPALHAVGIAAIVPT
jgi:hypothetical protein